MRAKKKGCIFANARYSSSSLGHIVPQAMLASTNCMRKAESKLSLPHTICRLLHGATLASSGCSIMVVYALWERVAGVRFPASRQQIKTSASWSLSLEKEECVNFLTHVGNRTPERCEFTNKCRGTHLTYKRKRICDRQDDSPLPDKISVALVRFLTGTVHLVAIQSQAQ